MATNALWPIAFLVFLMGALVIVLLKQNVVLVSYSMFIPYLLLVFHTSAKDFGKPDL